MASWQRRRGKCVTVSHYDTRHGRLLVLPRDLTRHLDKQPDHVIEDWVRKWEADNGKAKDRIERMVLRADDALRKQWDLYQLAYRRRQKRREATIAAETYLFENFIARFFVKERQSKDPTTWHPLVPGFHSWLYEQTMADATRRSILWALERFGKYLVFSQLMPYPFTVQIPNAENQKITPLKVKITPEEVLKIVRTHSFIRPHKSQPKTKHVCQINFRLAVLLGYFASLGPEELWALEKDDIQGGDLGMNRSKTYAGLKACGLGSKMSVAINKTFTGNAVTPEAKNDYRFGYVTIWSAEAARAIAEILKSLPSGRLFPFSRGHLEKAWREMVKPIIGATPHDLRRASCLYLGRTARIPTTLLQEHMRHAELDTTMLYCREPRVVMAADKVVVEQDLDDVG